MALSRRDFLKLGGLTAVAASATSCGVAGQQVAKRELPDELGTLLLAPDDSLSVDPIRRFLNRAGYGPRPGDVERVQEMGLAAYLEEQLAPEGIDDGVADVMMRRLNVYQMDYTQLLAQEPRDAARELIGMTITRALYSKRQLYEAMVAFWSDHFNIYLEKAKPMPLLKVLDDRDVIRPHALGKFRDLLFASAKSQAMLVYLDNIRNLKDEPNENYARELMELHTLGVHGGYDQRDVQEVARAFTGWMVRREGIHEGESFFNADEHDFDEKVVLGHTLPAGQGEEDASQVLEILVTHPATAEFIATKLVRRFVADEPPMALVQQVAETFQETDGDIKAMLRVIFLSEAFTTAPPKLKRPFTYMISAFRAVHADVGVHRSLGQWLRQLGQPLFLWPAPNGYPDVASAWTANLLPRWNFALALVHDGLERVTPPLEQLALRSGADSSEKVIRLFSRLIYGRLPDPAMERLFMDYVGTAGLDQPQTRQNLRDSVALMLASPGFQWT